MDVRRGRSRLFTFMCITFVVPAAFLQAGCELGQVAANGVSAEGAQKALASLFGFRNLTIDPLEDEPDDFDLDFPAE